MDLGRVIVGKAFALGALSVALAMAAGCSKDDPNQLVTTSAGAGGSGTGGDTTASGTGGAGTGGSSVLDERILSYTEALRSASFKLVGNAPTLQQMMDLKNAPDADKPTKYAEQIDAMMDDPRFAKRMVEFWRSAFRMFGPAAGQSPSRDTAPVFAARLVVEGRSYTELLTATDNTCPTFDETTGTFTDGSCNNGIQAVGILTDPGIHSLYFGNMAFRRNRFFHETFLCRKANDALAEPTTTPGPGGPMGYGSPWPWNSITGGPTANVDFLNTNGVICANCHATWNHRAILWANFDMNGQYQPTISVNVPVVGLPVATRTDWLPDTEPTAWKYGQPAADLTELGNVMAQDPEVHACAVARMWNYAMSRGDIVETGVKVSTEVIDPLVTQFETSNFNLRAMLKTILVNDDFVRF